VAELYYDPYDFEIDADPYPVWKRLRDEAPIYYNDRYGFWAVSRFDDVEKALVDWQTFISGKGSVLEMIKAGIEIPPGSILFEDPPTHDVHRSLLARVFTPRRMAAIEPQVRQFCANALDHLVDSGRFDFIADLGAQMPMRTIGMLLGIPEEDQERIRDRIDEGLRITEGVMPGAAQADRYLADGDFGTYLDWRAEHPSDDLMTELLTTEFEDYTGVVRTLTREEVLGYVTLLSGAGNETTTRLVGWTGKLLAEHPDQLAELAADPSLVPNAIEELFRWETPVTGVPRIAVQDVELAGIPVKAGDQVMVLLGSANVDDAEFPDADTVDFDRVVNRHLAFGGGVHRCLGSHLARLELRVALREFHARIPGYELAPGTVLEYTPGIRSLASLPLVWKA
jgi:cytochrome P450